jgi:PASTA domain
MRNVPLIRVLGALLLAALALTLTVAAAVPGAAANTTPQAMPTDAPARAMPTDAPAKALPTDAPRAKALPTDAPLAKALPTDGPRAKALPTDAPAAASTTTVALPRGAAACPSTATKPSSAAAACAGAAPSGAVAAALEPFVVTLAADTPAVPPGATVTLTATSNQDVGPTPWYIELYDVTSGLFLANCGFGTTCTTTVRQTGSAVRNYVAYISNLGTAFPPPQVQAQSPVVGVSWLTVTLSVSFTRLPPGATTQVTATASLDVGPTPYWIEIFDTRSGAFVASCGSGTICGASVTNTSGVATYVAYISALGATFPPPNIRAQSNGTLVSWASVDVSTSATTVTVGSAVTVTATASLDVGPTPWYIDLFDLTTGALLAFCPSGTTCSASVSQGAPTQHSYIAFVAAASGSIPPFDIRATSNTPSVSWVPAQVTVPNLVNQPDGDVPSILSSAGLVLGRDSEVVDCEHLDKVVRQSPAAGTSVAAGSAVDVTHGVLPTPPAECQ